MKRETALLVERANTALSDAETLCVSGSPAGNIARAYYAVFHAASATLVERDIVTKTHRGTQQRFYEAVVQGGSVPTEMAKTLTDLYEKRQGADYEIGAVFTQDMALRAVEEARAFVEAIERLLTPPDAE